MTRPRLYLDEDVQSGALIQALRARGADVLTTTEARMSNRTDADQLRFARSQQRILVTCNVGDFARLHKQWMAAGLEHAGILLIRQQKWGPGELARRIIRLLAATPGPALPNRMEYLGNW